MKFLQSLMIRLAFTPGRITLGDTNNQENCLLSQFRKIQTSPVSHKENRLRVAQNLLTFALAPLATLALMMVPAAGMTAEEDTIVFLVRHAEKLDESQDPGLSGAGRQRSLELAQLLRDAGINHIHSTDYIRSRDTAAPLADSLGLEVELYSWDEAPEFARSLIQSGQRHLVVGHSNTTTDLVELLGGDAGSAIDHSGEYDRLYVLTIDAGQSVTTLLMRYGAPFRDH